MPLLARPLRFQHDTLQLFKDNELLVRVINLGISLFFRNQKPGLFETLELTLYIARVFFDKLRETPNMGFKVRILGIDDDYLAPNS